MIYHLPEQISLKTRSFCMHYIIMSNLLLQFTQLIHYPLPPLVFYHFIVLYIRGRIYMSILTASLWILLFAYPVATFLWLQYIMNGCMYKLKQFADIVYRFWKFSHNWLPDYWPVFVAVGAKRHFVGLSPTPMPAGAATGDNIIVLQFYNDPPTEFCKKYWM